MIGYNIYIVVSIFCLWAWTKFNQLCYELHVCFVFKCDQISKKILNLVWNKYNTSVLFEKINIHKKQRNITNSNN